MHTVRNWHPHVVGVRHRVHHYAHRLVHAATPPQAVMTVCQRVVGPIVAGGLVLLPPASAPPPAGGVGGFPGAIVPEYGAPAFGPGYASGSPIGYSPGGGYGPAALGLGGIIGPGGSTVPASSTVVASAVPVISTPTTTITTPGTSVPETTPVLVTTTTGDNSTPKKNDPSTTDGPPTGGTPPGGDTTKTPGDGTPVVNTPEPASLPLVASGLAAVIFARMLWTRRVRRG